jgi:hypothetical protein
MEALDLTALTAAEIVERCSNGPRAAESWSAGILPTQGGRVFPNREQAARVGFQNSAVDVDLRF